MMREAQQAGGDVLVYAKVHNAEARRLFWHLLENLPGERVSPTVYEVFTADWDEGMWEEEVARMEELIDQATDTLILWRAVDGKLLRTCIAGRFA
jgi:hypothetical protein